MEQQFSVAPHELRRGVGAVYPAIQLYNDSHVGGGLHLATSAGLKQKVLNASNQPDSVNAVFFSCGGPSALAVPLQRTRAGQSIVRARGRQTALQVAR